MSTKPVILFLIGLVVITAGILYYRNNHDTAPAWAIYRNDDLGIKFEYRLQQVKYILVEQDEQETGYPNLVEFVTIFNEEEYQELVASTVPREGPPGISVLIFDNPSNYSPQAWADNFKNISNISLARSAVSTTNFAGVPAIRFLADGLYTNDVIIAHNNGRIYYISGAYADENSRIRKDFLEMIDNFSLY